MTAVCLTFDFDAFSLWVSTFKQTSATPLSRGEYSARVGVGRVLDLLHRAHIPATFFIPGHTAATFPDAVRRIRDAGHEIGSHGYCHESPVALGRTEEVDLLRRSIDKLRSVLGSDFRPLGYRSPAWDLSNETVAILEEEGFVYDSSMMADDYRPYHPRRGDRVDEHGFAFGSSSSIIEFPVAWELDDFPYFHFVAKPMNQGLRDPAEVEAIWREEFDACRALVPDGVFTLTMHPEIIGRGPRIAMLERLVDYMADQPDVRFTTLVDEAQRRRDQMPNLQP